MDLTTDNPALPDDGTATQLPAAQAPAHVSRVNFSLSATYLRYREWFRSPCGTTLCGSGGVRASTTHRAWFRELCCLEGEEIYTLL